MNSCCRTAIASVAFSGVGKLSIGFELVNFAVTLLVMATPLYAIAFFTRTPSKILSFAANCPSGMSNFSKKTSLSGNIWRGWPKNDFFREQHVGSLGASGWCVNRLTSIQTGLSYQQTTRLFVMSLTVMVLFFQL